MASRVCRPPVLVGRQRELDELADAVSQPPAVVLVEGEAGIGKSRLVQEFLATRPAARRVLVATCPPFLESLTLGPVIDAIRRSCDSVRGLPLTPLAGALRPIFPEWAAGLPPSPEPMDDARAARHRLFRALAELIHCLDIGVLIVEDVHWVDESTLEFLLFLSSDHGRPLSLVVTYRPEDVPAGSVLRRLSSRPAGAVRQVRITLAPLDVARTAELISSMLDGGAVSAGFATFMHERTEGLPLAVEESVRLLSNRDDLVRRGDRWVQRGLADLQVPPTVRDLVLERFYRLTSPARLVLSAAAVYAAPADETTVGELAGLAAGQASTALGEAVECGLLVEVEGGRLAFRHALMRSAVYTSIPAPHRRRLHLAAGRLLETVEPRPVAQLAQHFRMAGAAPEWARYAEAAAEQAIAAYDHAAAVAMLDAVLTAGVADPATRGRLALQLGTAALGDPDEAPDRRGRVARTLSAVIESAGLTALERARIRTRLGRLKLIMLEVEEGRAELERAIPHLADLPAEAARVCTYLGWPYAGPHPATVHMRHLRRAAILAPRVRSSTERLALTLDQAVALLLFGVEDGWALTTGIPADSTSPDVRHEIARGCTNLGYAALLWGRYDAARQFHTRAARIIDEDALVRLRSLNDVNWGELEWRTAAWGTLAERLENWAVADDVPAINRPVVDALRGRLLAVRGDRAAAVECFGFAMDRGRQGVADQVITWSAELGQLRLADGDVAGALSITDEPQRLLIAMHLWICAADFLPVRVEALIAAGREAEASALVAALGRGIRGRTAPSARAVLDICRAVFAEARRDHQRAAAGFARAAERWRRLPRPYDALLAGEREAGSLVLAGRVEAGVARLAEVYRGLVDLGAAVDADRVAGRLREHGAPIRRPWRGGRRGYGDELSPSELEVVRFVATGQTNQMIAAALSKSPKTVAMQVNSAMRKLGVSTRTALAVKAVENGMAPSGRAPAAPVEAGEAARW